MHRKAGLGAGIPKNNMTSSMDDPLLVLLTPCHRLTDNGRPYTRLYRCNINPFSLLLRCEVFRMPAKVKVRIVAGRDLPVMDRASDLTDAFVEVSSGHGVSLVIVSCRVQENIRVFSMSLQSTQKLFCYWFMRTSFIPQ